MSQEKQKSVGFIQGHWPFFVAFSVVHYLALIEQLIHSMLLDYHQHGTAVAVAKCKRNRSVYSKDQKPTFMALAYAIRIKARA